MSNLVDVNFIKPFVEGTVGTLKVQCGLDAKHGKPYVKNKSTEGDSKVDIAGMIGITSDVFKGSIAICFPEKTFLAVMGNMLGETYHEITRDMEDGAGELINIIFGMAKRVLNEKGYSILKALPTVVRGNGIQIRHLTPTPIVVLPFETPVGPFQIEVGIESVGKNSEGGS